MTTPAHTPATTTATAAESAADTQAAVDTTSEHPAKSLTIVSLYPRDMNIYGDRGNVLALSRRARQHGFDVHIVDVNPGDEIPADADIVLGGGGQDSGQGRVALDLITKGEQLRQMASDGTPMLMICGLYQLFGHRFVTHTGDELQGIGVLDVETRGGDVRMIGNIVVDSPEFGQIVGYENHSGDTVLGAGSSPLGVTPSGTGNNPRDGHEGARTHNVIGSYLHGSLLPKNPALSDFLIGTAAVRKYGAFVPEAPDELSVLRARQSAMARPR